MEQSLGEKTFCNSFQLKNTSDWRIWDRDFAEAKEVNSIAKLRNVEADTLPFNFGVSETLSKGRGRINICLRDCKIPIAEQMSHSAYSSVLSSSSQLPNTGKFCKFIGKGRGRGRRMQGFQPLIGQKLHGEESEALRKEIKREDSHLQVSSAGLF